MCKAKTQWLTATVTLTHEHKVKLPDSQAFVLGALWGEGQQAIVLKHMVNTVLQPNGTAFPILMLNFF